MMRLHSDEPGPVEDEFEVLTGLLSREPLNILDLGCGAALMSRRIAENYPQVRLTGYEVDRRQHEKNIAAPTVGNLKFKLGGAEKIAERDAETDWVFMFKSLHHVPTGALEDALAEIARVLRPGGCVYISEPVFAGDLNEIMRLFHDEERVRQAAFHAVLHAVDQGILVSRRQVFFRQVVSFENYADYERQAIRVTHTDHRLSDEVYAQVRRRFDEHVHRSGAAEFFSPMRVDILTKPV